MKFRFLIEEAVQALRHNILRSLLTVVGIVVGIVSVTAMLGLGEGLSSNILGRLSSFAQGDVTVSGSVTYADVAWITARPYVKAAVAEKTASGADVVAMGSDFSPTVESVVGDYEDIQNYAIESGGVFDFSDPDVNDDSAVVSDGFAKAVSDETGRSVQGQPILVGGKSYTVIGVISSNAMAFTRGDGVVLIPYARLVGTLSGTKDFSTVGVLLKDSSYYDIAGTDILAGLNASRYLAADSKDAFTVETAQSIIQSAKETSQTITLFLGVIGGIALFVGGIGTMNMMLTTVTERTKEIGLRKAVGARDRDILLQILAESVLLTAFGGAIGIGIAVTGSYIANGLLANGNFITILISWRVVLFSAFVALAIGVIFGVYPARRASRLQPVDALRTE
jgi:putative ABC transport system permease protein